MTFANQEWLWLLCGLPLLAALRVRSHVLSRRGAPGLVSPRLRGKLIVGNNLWLRWVTFTFHLLALALVITSLARPRWGFEEAETATEGRNVLIAIDTSRSMLANDLQPDRLTRAKLAAVDIMDALPEDRIGLVAFAGKAFLSAPLTIDHDAVLESIEQMDTEIIPRGGTNLVEPVKMALETFEKAGTKDSALIIFSDGEDLEGDVELENVRKQAVETGMVIVAVGVGTERGSIIPDDSEKGFVTDEGGNVVRSRLNPTALQAVSAETGVYLNLGSNSAMTSVVTTALKQVEKTLAEDGSGQKPIERFMWPLGAAVLFILVAFLLPESLRFIRRLRVDAELSSSARKAIILLGTLGLTPVAEANMTSEVPAYIALKSEAYEDAISEFETEIEQSKPGNERAWLNLGLGSAAYRIKDYDRAKIAWGDALREGNDKLNTQAHYNLGNALFREGREILDTAGFVFPGEEPETPVVAAPDPDDGMAKLLADQLKSLGLDKMDAQTLTQVLRAVSIAPQTSAEERDQINGLLVALQAGVVDVESVISGLLEGMGFTDEKLAAAPEAPTDPNANIDIAPTVEQWLSAIEHYEAALELTPDNAEAQRNIEVVRSYLEAIQPPEQEENKDKEDEQEDEEDEEDEKEEEEEEEEKQDEPEDDEKEDDQNEDDNKDENQDPNEDQNDQPQEENDNENEENNDQPQDPNQPDPQSEDPQDPNDPNDPGDDGEQDQQPPPEGDGNPDEQPPGEGDQDPNEPQESESPDGEPQEPEQGEDGEEQPADQSDQSQGQDQQPQNQQPQPPMDPGAPPEPTPEGELEAEGNSPPPQPSQAGQQAGVDPAEMQTNPETGFSPSQARSYLQNLTDEDFEVRPLVPMGSSKSEKFKNW